MKSRAWKWIPPYRVLHVKDGVENAWDFDKIYDAEEVFWKQKNFDKCMLLLVSHVNVRLLKER